MDADKEIFDLIEEVEQVNKVKNNQNNDDVVRPAA